MHKVLVLVPFPFEEKGLGLRRAQLDEVRLGPDIEFDYKPVKVAPALFDSYHDYLIADLGVFEAGLQAQEDGYDAVCIDTMSDSGVEALRSVLDIPVIGPARASYLIALMLGNKFSILTYGDPEGGRLSQVYVDLYRKTLKQYGLLDKCASIQMVNIATDMENLLTGKEEVAFPLLVEAGRKAIEDGADVICLGSTTLHQAGIYLNENLPVPVINPGPLSYKLAELVLGLGLTHSRAAYPKPQVPKPEMVHAMLEAAVATERAAV